MKPFVVLLMVSLLSLTAGYVRSQPMELDQHFIDMMVPHHEGAVAMARIAQDRAEHQEVADLAADIIRSQEAEIALMKAWRLAWYGSDETPPMTRMPMVGEMSGMPMEPMMQDLPGMPMGPSSMDMAGEVEALRDAPEPFDLAFIDAMIPHHEMAIIAARMAVQHALHEEIRELAGAIIADQQREIDLMRQWRSMWYGSEAPGQMEPTPGMPMMEH